MLVSRQSDGQPQCHPSCTKLHTQFELRLGLYFLNFFLLQLKVFNTILTMMGYYMELTKRLEEADKVHVLDK